MTDVRKQLGQSKPAAATPDDLYTVPANTEATISTLNVCNQGAATTFRMLIAPAGASTSDEMYYYYDAPIAANDTFQTTAGFTMAATDVMRVESASGDVSFTLNGVENS